MMWFMQRRNEARFPQGPLPDFTPLYLQSASTFSSRIPPPVQSASTFSSTMPPPVQSASTFSPTIPPPLQPVSTSSSITSQSTPLSAARVRQQGYFPHFVPLHLQSATSTGLSRSPIRPQPQSRLLSLPAEIRVIIYEHVFTSETTSQHLDFKAGAPYQRATAGRKSRYFLTCRQIATEAESALYAHHLFRFSHTYRIFRHPLASLGGRDYTIDRPTPWSVFEGCPWDRQAKLSHVSVSYFLNHQMADELNNFDFWTRGSKTNTGTLDGHLAEIVRIFRRSCPRLKSFTLEMATGSSPRLLQNYCSADLWISERSTSTREFGRVEFGSVLGYQVLEELKQMSCLEGGSLERLRLVAVTEQREEGKTMQIVGAGNKRWHEIEYTLTNCELVRVFLVDKDFKKDARDLMKHQRR